MAARQSDSRGDGGRSFSLREFAAWMKRRRRGVVCLIFVCVAAAIAASYYIPVSNVRESKISLKYVDNNVFTAQRHSRNRDDLKSIAIKPFATGLSIENGRLLIQSQKFCENVVLDLGLQYGYCYQTALGKRIDLYRDAPVAVEGIPIDFDKSVELQIGNDEPMRVDGLRIDGEKVAFSASVGADGSVKTPVGTLRITRWKGQRMEHPVVYTYTPVDKMAARVSKGLQIKQTAKFTDVLTCTYSDVSVRRADDILNRLPKTYDEIWSIWNHSDAQKFRDAVEARLAVHSARLSETENRLAQLLASNSTLSIDANYMFLSKNITADRYSACLAERSVAALETAAEQLTGDLADDRPVAAETLAAADTSLQKSISRYNELMARRATLLNNAGASNPKYLEADRQLRSMRPAIVASLNSALQVKRIELDGLRRRLAEADKEIGRLAKLQDSVNRLTREQQISQSQYVYMTSKRENDPLAVNNISEATRVISPATGQPARSPLSPVNAALLGLIIGGVILPLMLFQFSRLTNLKVRCTDDVEALGLPILGSVSLTSPLSRRQKILRRFNRTKTEYALPEFVLDSEGNTHSIDEVMTLRTNLDYQTAGCEASRVCIFTSLDSGSGATFTAVNIAHAEARTGGRVLVIDANPARPTVSRLVGTPFDGLSTCLSNDTADIASLIRSEEAGFDILPCGDIRPGMAEMMSSSRMTTLIRTLKSQYDLIIIDCTATRLLAPAATLSHIATSTVIVLRAGITRLSSLRQIEKMKAEGILTAPLLVVNGIETQA